MATSPESRLQLSPRFSLVQSPSIVETRLQMVIAGLHTYGRNTVSYVLATNQV